MSRAAVLACVAAAAVAGLASCGDGGGSPGAAGRPAAAGKGAPATPPAGTRRALRFPVEVAAVIARDVQYRVLAVGSVEAFETVQVTARVQGVIEAVRFAEGDVVLPGRILVEIEPQRYRLAVDAARATLEKAVASHAEARAGLERREAAVERQPGVIPEEELQTWRTKLRTAEAETLQTRAALAQAELNLHDAYVRAPVGGTIQTRSVQTGEYVQTGTTLATLQRRDPLLLRFAVTEQDARRVQPGMRASFDVRGSSHHYAVRIVHVAASADPATRMVAVTGRVEPGDAEAPRPGTFAQVSVPVGSASGAAVVPETAVRPSERGFIGYVVQGGLAHERVLELGMRTEDGLVEVHSGVAPGESLVVRGAEALRDGAAVRVVAGGVAANSAPGAPQ